MTIENYVCLPYQCPDHYDLFVEYLGKLPAIIVDYESSKVAIIDDFNAALFRVGKMPAFMSKVHAGGIYRYLPAFTGIYRRLLEFTGVY